MSFTCEAVYLGHRAVEGAQTPASIGGLVGEVVARTRTGAVTTDSFRKVGDQYILLKAKNMFIP